MMFNQNNDDLCAMQGYKNKQIEGGEREGGRERERDTHTHTHKGRDGEAGRGTDREGGNEGRQISGVEIC